MRARRLLLRSAWCLIIVMASGCARTSAPKGWLPDVTQAGNHAFGAWISAETMGNSHTPRIEGELISVANDSVFMFVGAELRGLPLTVIKRADIEVYDPESLAGWTTLGALSTLSHGGFLIFTAPLWIITGTIATRSVVESSMLHYPNSKWAEISNYARFPRGFPAGLDRGALRHE